MPPKVQPRPQATRRSNRHAHTDSQAPTSPKESVEDTVNLDSATDVTTEADNAANTSATAEVSTNATAPPLKSRPPVQRLDSLRRRNVPPTSPATSASGSQAPPTLKFQPKSVIRRSKEEREAFSRAEEEKRQARLAAGPPVHNARGGSGGGDGGAFSRGGFRGGMSGWRAERKGIGQATGPLSGPTSEQSSKPVRGRGGSNAVRSSAVSARAEASLSRLVATKATMIKDEPAVTSTGLQRSPRKGKEPKIKVEEGPTYVSSNSDDGEGPRINIEHINLISDESSEEESSKGKGKERENSVRIPGWSMKPIRLDRHEHIERTAGAATAATSLTSAERRQRALERSKAEGALFVSDDEEQVVTTTKPKKHKSKGKDVEFIRGERKWKGVYRDDDDLEESTKIKDEPQDEDTIIPDAVSPEVQPFVEDHTNDDAATAAAAETSQKVKEDSPVTKRKKPLFRPFKPVLQTEEDRQEWERYEDDVTALGEELGLTGPSAMPVSAPDAEGDTEMKDDSEVEKDRKQGLVYLFQLPPILPYLIDATEAEKDDPEEIPIPVPAPEIKPSTKTPTSSKPSKTPIKIEDNDSDTDLSKPSNALMAEDEDDFTGSLGKLTIYESGYIGISWGGIEYELSKSAGGELLQEVVVGDVGRVKKEEDGEVGGIERTGIAMGQIAGGFVVTPNWESLFEG